MTKQFYIYIITNKRYGTLYAGVTSNLPQRAYQHRNKLVDGFSKTHGLTKLVYYESHENAESAILREKQIKNWKREWKLELIEKSNPHWHDLYESLIKNAV